MKRKKMTIILSLIFLTSLFCGTSAFGQTCDGSLAKHVYNPQRLKVLAPCVTVTGTLVDATHGKRKDGVRHEADGDAHAWLKLDIRQVENYSALHFLNNKNMKNEGGNLVVEPICLYRATQKDALAACKDFQSPVKLPPVGSHIRVTGPFVLDTQHGHNEIHPISRIDAMP